MFGEGGDSDLHHSEGGKLATVITENREYSDFFQQGRKGVEQVILVLRGQGEWKALFGGGRREGGPGGFLPGEERGYMTAVREEGGGRIGSPPVREKKGWLLGGRLRVRGSRGSTGLEERETVGQFRRRRGGRRRHR